MSRPRTAWAKAMMAVLADGQWHDREELLAVGMAAVPPGVAWREAERGRQAQRRRHGWPPRDRATGHAQAVAVGAREKAVDALDRRVAMDTLVRRDVGGRVLLRLAAAAETSQTPSRFSPVMAQTTSEADG